MRQTLAIWLLITCFIPCSVFAVTTLQDQKLASAFLLRTTYGPTMGEINQLANRISAIGATSAFTEWVDQQLLIPASGHKRLARQMEMDDREYFNWDPADTEFVSVAQHRYKHYAWWHLAITAPDQLRQRMAWALNQIFVVSTVGNSVFNAYQSDMSGNGQWLGIIDYYDQMVNNAFGNYRGLIEDVTLHPVMGRYLSHVRNPKGDGINVFPDENYAREVMQLFSIGLNELNIDGTWQLDANNQPIPTYDNETIKNFARVFTGLSYETNTPTPNSAQGFEGYLRNLTQPMIMFDEFHDTDSKILLNGVTLPMGQTGMQDINDALDNLSNHANIGPFIARQLIQRFVMSNPSKAYIQAVAEVFNNNGNNVRGDLSAVIKAVLLHDDAINFLIVQNTEHSRLREPILRYTSLLRAFSPVSEFHTGRFMVHSSRHRFYQSPYQAPHVFNFYLPDYQPPGEILSTEPSVAIPNGKLVAPEYEILNGVTANELSNWVRYAVRGAGISVPHGSVNYVLVNNANTTRIEARTILDQSPANTVAANASRLVDSLDLLLCGGGLSYETKTVIASKIDQLITPSYFDPKLFMRVKTAIIGIVMSPECAVQ